MWKQKKKMNKNCSKNFDKAHSTKRTLDGKRKTYIFIGNNQLLDILQMLFLSLSTLDRLTKNRISIQKKHTLTVNSIQ